MTEKEFLKSIGRECYIIPYHRSKEDALAEVTNDGLALRYCPESIMDKDIVMAAVTDDGLALRYCHDSIIDEEIVRAAINSDEEALQYVKPCIFTEEEIIELNGVRYKRIK